MAKLKGSTVKALSMQAIALYASGVAVVIVFIYFVVVTIQESQREKTEYEILKDDLTSEATVYNCPEANLGSVLIVPSVWENATLPDRGYALAVPDLVDITKEELLAYYNPQELGTEATVYLKENIDEIMTHEGAIFVVVINSTLPLYEMYKVLYKETIGHAMAMCWSYKNMDRLEEMGLTRNQKLAIIDGMAIPFTLKGKEEYEMMRYLLPDPDAEWVKGFSPDDPSYLAWPSCGMIDFAFGYAQSLDFAEGLTLSEFPPCEE